MRVPTRLTSVAALAAILVVSGCKSPEEKAQDLYLSGVEYVKADDPVRAMIQFRNALLHAPDHRGAGLARAELLENQGDAPGALAAFTTLSEQFPDDMSLRHRLLSFAVERQNWQDTQRHAEAILALAPDAPEAEVADIVRAYRSARRGAFDTEAASAAGRAIAMRAKRPEDRILLLIVLDWYDAQEDHVSALEVLDEVLSRDPGDRDLQLHRVALLASVGAEDIAGDRLRRMVTLFPEDRRIRGLFVAWLVSDGQTDEAETFLRKLASGGLDRRNAQAEVIAFLDAHRGADVADEEISRLIADTEAGADQRFWRSIQASRLFANGDEAQAVSLLRVVVEEEQNADDRHVVQVMLARMLHDLGEVAEADALIDTVLTEVPLQADALQFRAMRLLRSGQPTQAIADLRSALAHRPRDPNVLGLMARVHLAQGERDLAGERLASAFEASAMAPRPALTYAAFLRQDGRDEVAERVLRSALNRAPLAGDVKAALAELLVDRGRFGEAAVLIDELAASGLSPEAARLHARRLAAQGRQAEGLAFLRGLSQRGEDEFRPIASVVQTLVRAGRAEEALDYVDLAEVSGESVHALWLLRASLLALLGRRDGAIDVLSALLEEDPGNVQATSLLVPLLRADGLEQEAEATLARALTATPQSRELRLMEASRREARGDIAGAIALLEELHAENSADLVAANNLASLLTRTQPGPEAPGEAAVQRARAAARVLRGLPEPAFQDTYGWVEFLRGNLGEALSYLEPAARALPTDARVQYHLGRTYQALGRSEAARAQFALVAELDAEALLPETASALALLDAQ